MCLHVSIFRTWGHKNFGHNGHLWDKSKIGDHLKTHETLAKKKVRADTAKLLHSINCSMIVATAKKNVPISFWETTIFIDILEQFKRLVESCSDPIDQMKKIVGRNRRTNDTLKLNDDIKKVNFYN